MAESDLLRFNKKQVYLTWDCETENLRLGGSNRPWQLSYSLSTQDEILEEHDDFPWWPDLDISAGAAAITRFNYEEYKAKAKDPKKILEKFDSYLYDPDILNVFANGFGFDTFIHNIIRLECGKKSNYDYVKNSLCIQCIEKAQILGIKEISQDPIKRAAQMFSLTNYRKRGLKTNVKFLCEKNGIEYDVMRGHDGLYDVSRTKAIFDKQIWQINI